MSKDVALEKAQRDFDSNSGAPKWELKPHETVCPVCWLVKPCDC